MEIKKRHNSKIYQSQWIFYRLLIKFIHYIYKVRKRKLIVAIIVFTFAFQFLAGERFWWSENEIERIKSENQVKVVQLLTQRFYFPNWGLDKLGSHPFASCPENRCFAFQPHFWRNKPFENSDGVIVHVPDLHFMSFRNSYKRNPRQLWLFYTQEPQRYSYCSHYYSINEMDDWFNITATFKPNSDVHVPYTGFDKLSNLHRYSNYLKKFIQMQSKQDNFLEKQLTRPKKRLALWVVSHCHTSSKRENYIGELQKYMNVDVYGWCNWQSLPCDQPKIRSKKACIREFFDSYKFYLAFENSKCDHYITEKYFQFYNSVNFFEINTVPVVSGPPPEHYGEPIFGHRNFIHVDSFDSPKSLAEYLLYLDRNNTAYLEYFEWKRKLMRMFESQAKLYLSNNSVEFLDKSFSSNVAPFCEICAKLHDESYLNRQNRPTVKITEQFNPARDCRDQEDPNHIKTFIKKIIGKCV